MLLEIALGDAYGMGFEFASPELLSQRLNDGQTYYPHPFHDIDPGCYTDDTQMSLAVAEVVLAEGRNATREDFAEAFVRAFHRDPRLGYSNGFIGILSGVANGPALTRALRPDSKGSGSAMRACPVGFLPTLEDVLRVAEIQARITHDTPEGVAAAQGVAAMVHFGLIEGPAAGKGLRDRLRRLDPVLNQALARPHEGRVPNKGLPALNAALGVVEKAANQQDAAIRSVAIGGDVDTVAAVAMGVLSLLFEEDSRGLPKPLLDGLERGSFGFLYLQALDDRLSILKQAAPERISPHSPAG